MKRVTLSLFLLLSACQAGKAPSAAERADGATPPAAATSTAALQAESADPLLEALEKSEPVCEENKKCFSDTAVQVVVLRENGSVEKCPGFMVNDTTVATNSACLGDTPGECSKRVGIKFPKSYSGEKKIRLCAEVVPYGKKAEGSLLTGADFAFFKIQP